MPPRRMPRDEARRARTDVYRQHVFEAAERVFAERGFEAAKLQEISRLAGLSMGTIYAIFPSKTDLFRAILEERAHTILRAGGIVMAAGHDHSLLEGLCDRALFLQDGAVAADGAFEGVRQSYLGIGEGRRTGE